MENARGGNRHGLSAVFFEKIGCLIGRHGGPDGWITELSVGQVMAACRAEVDALGLHAPSFRIRTGAEPEPGAKTNVLGVGHSRRLIGLCCVLGFRTYLHVRWSHQTTLAVTGQSETPVFRRLARVRVRNEKAPDLAA